MPPRSLVDLTLLADIATGQDGLVTARQLAELGMGPSSVRHRIRTGGPWLRALPGVYLTTNGALTRRQELRAAHLYAGPSAVITGLDAVDARGPVRRVGPRPTEQVHVLVPHGRHRSSTGFVVVERTQRMPEAFHRWGLPFAPPTRAVVDACRRMGRRSDVDALVAHVVQSGEAEPADLEVEVEQAQIRGTALVRAAVRSVAAGTRSAPEADLRRRWLASPLPSALWNAELRTADGAFIARPDAYVESLGLAVEVDSKEFHFSPADWARTMERHARLAAHGVVTIHAPPRRVARDWRRLRDDIRAAVASLEGRPPPDVVVHRPHETRPD